MRIPELHRPTPGQWVALALGVLPWTWYLVRDLSGRMDIIALAWPVFGTVITWAPLIAAFLMRRRRVLAAAVSWALCLGAVVVGPWRPLDTGSVRPDTAIRIVAGNTYADNTYAPGVAEEFAAQHPDVLVVSEVTPESGSVYAEGYRYAVRPQTSKNDVAVFSNLPMHAQQLPGVLGSQRGWRVEIDGPDGPFVLYALHLQKPGAEPSKVEVGFRTHRRIIEEVVDAVRRETLPVVVAGDLNLVDRTTGYRALTGVLDDAMRAGWVGPTSRKRSTRLLLARIDHIFEPEDWCSSDAKTFTMRGSDHRAVVTTIGRCR